MDWPPRGHGPGRRTQARTPTRQVKLAQQMYDELDDQGRNKFTVAQIAAEFGVSRPTVYRYLDQSRTPTLGEACTAPALENGAQDAITSQISEIGKLTGSVSVMDRTTARSSVG